jgi:outer membrane lipoprotein-sorting protein
MRAKYLGKWFKTVTFSQQTIQTRPTGVVDTSTWYEALKSPDRLRIDFGDPKNGNGVIYTADSLYVVRSDTIARTVASGNPFLPFVAGVYAQPLDTTLRQIGVYKFDLNKVYTTTWEGRPVEVAGAQAASDTLSPQFWVDKERLVVVRMLVALNPSAPTDVADIRLEDYRPVAGGWLAVRVAIMRGGKVIQKEEYADWRGNVDLPDDFFVAQQWGKVPHWHR